MAPQQPQCFLVSWIVCVVWLLYPMLQCMQTLFLQQQDNPDSAIEIVDLLPRLRQQLAACLFCTELHLSLLRLRKEGPQAV